jgi:hypothetical protein
VEKGISAGTGLSVQRWLLVALNDRLVMGDPEGGIGRLAIQGDDS